MQLRVADLLRDAGMLPQVQAVAEKLYQEHGQHTDALIRRWIGQADQYGEV
jgi:ATP-dependent DNA helicase RecG